MTEYTRWRTKETRWTTMINRRNLFLPLIFPKVCLAGVFDRWHLWSCLKKLCASLFYDGSICGFHQCRICRICNCNSFCSSETNPINGKSHKYTIPWTTCVSSRQRQKCVTLLKLMTELTFFFVYFRNTYIRTIFLKRTLN